jgi:L-threonylcarbamoyladenylate synthase
MPELTAAHASRLDACLAQGGVALIPTDTVYGLCCAPDQEPAVRRLYEIKGRPATRPAAVMFFSLDAATAALPELHEPELRACRALLPGPLTLLLPNRAVRYPLACSPPGGDEAGPSRAERGDSGPAGPGGGEPGRGGDGALGLRVPALPAPLASLGAIRRPVMQSSANLSGGPAPRALSQVPAELRARVDLQLDAGELPGTASTVLDLRELASDGRFGVVREGPVGAGQIERRLCGAGLLC